ncbi:MAG: hypothetical protein B7Z67_14535 [Acidiphilium sp. 21-60-14]|nr:MAG: hypothetical protein B7Z67_14535 [Acidiphilium sp. 21-60-14]
MVANVGRASAVSAQYLTKTGLVPAQDMHKVKGSSTYLFNPDDLYGANYLKKHGFLEWLHNRVIPYLRKHGDNTPQKLMRDLAGIFPASTSARLFAWVVHNWPQRDRAKHLVQKAVRDGHPYQAAIKQWNVQVENFSKAFGGLISALGLPAVKGAVSALQWVTKGVHDLTFWLSKHPTVAKHIDQMLLALGGALVTFGGILAGAGIVALLGTGGTLAALAAAIGAVGAVMLMFNWKALGHAVDSGIRAVGNAINWLLHPLQKAMTYLLGPTHPGAASHNVGIAALRNPYAHPGATGTQVGLGLHPLFHYCGGNGGHWVHHGSLAGGFDTWAPGPPPSSEAGGSSSTGVHITNPHDIAKAIHRGLGASLNRNQSGTTGFNGRVSPAGSPAYADGL